MKSLVLAEKPSAAKEIARILGCREKRKHFYEGPEHVVTWALGHLVTLAEPEDYDPKYKTWKLEDLPILPDKMKLKILRESAHQFKAIQQLCRRGDLKELIIATDAGREGELVARWIMEMVHWRKPFKRLWISSQTDQAIKKGFAELKPGKNYDNLYASAVCRAQADWLIGLNVTRALTVKYNAQLAAGRVQTPTLAMLIEREREISRFQSVPYWTVTARFGGFSAQWRKDASHDGRIFEQAEALRLAQEMEGKAGRVAGVWTKEKTEPPPLAYDLTELQRDANRRLGFSAKHTSSVLQKLYEHHKLVTYPRTDSRYLSTDLIPTLPERLRSVAVGPYLPLVKPLLGQKLRITKRIVDDAKVTDHHAIIPTEEPVNLNALTADERRLYDLIVRRFIALFYPPCAFAETKLVIAVGKQQCYARGRTLLSAGWRELYGSEPIEEEDEAGEGGDEAQTLPVLQAGETLPAAHCRIEAKRTRPPSRYSEAVLLTQMEKHHLGTPATRAEIIEKLLQTETIERQGGKLVPTAKGKQLIELVNSELRSPELTAKWERELEDIAQGRGNSAGFIQRIRVQAARLVQEVKNSSAEYKPHNVTHSHCPDCGKLLVVKKTKQGKMLVCQDRECGYRRAAEPKWINRRCPQCGKKMELHEGRAGKYAQCRPCNIIEMQDEDRDGRLTRKKQAQLIRQYSDNVTLTSSLGKALKEALSRQKADKEK